MKHKKVSVTLLCLLLILVGFSGWSYLRPLPVLTPTSLISDTTQINSQKIPSISWPDNSPASIGVNGYRQFTNYQSSTALPTASVAKIMLALGVLSRKPLSIGQSGSNLTINANDVSTYTQDHSQDQSVVNVQVGEQLSEYQALQAILIPSANNMAVTLANWTFGSLSNYIKWANDYANQLGMTHTTFGDASGYSPSTVSTPNDLVLLGEKAIQNPVIAQIVNQPSVNLPVAGLVKNVNFDLGKNNINGIKTGNTDQADGCFLFSANDQSLTVVGAIMHAPNLSAALSLAPSILQNFESVTEVKQIIDANQIVGYYALPWGGKVNILTGSSLTALNWRDYKPVLVPSINKLNDSEYNSKTVGNLVYSFNGTSHPVPLVLANKIQKPGLWWKIFHW